MDKILSPDLEGVATSAVPDVAAPRRVENGQDSSTAVSAVGSRTSTRPLLLSQVSAGRDSTDRPRGASWVEAVEEMDVAQLRSLAVSLPVIEQAKGLLMGYYGCDAAAAFAVLRRWSSTHQVKVRDLAAALLDHASAETPHPPGPPDPDRPPDPAAGTPASTRAERASPSQGVQAFIEAMNSA